MSPTRKLPPQLKLLAILVEVFDFVTEGAPVAGGAKMWVRYECIPAPFPGLGYIPTLDAED
jgi:hypothetical protein